MDLTTVQDTLRSTTGPVVVAGARTQWETGGALTCGDDAVEVRAPAGIVAYDPADLTVRVRAGTTVAELDAVLAEHAQECVLDAAPDATLGGVFACGLSGVRRLRWGPLRDRVLEVRMVLADGTAVKGGGPTVKNVSGYDVPRLAVGSFGTLGVLTEFVLRCQPRAGEPRWGMGGVDPFEVRDRTARPSAILWDGAMTAALFEGHPGDIDEDLERSGLDPVEDPALSPPIGLRPPIASSDVSYRGRVSVAPALVRAAGPALGAAGLAWVAEIGVGTIDVAGPTAEALLTASDIARECGGWLLRTAGPSPVPPAPVAPENAVLMSRIRDAFDPHRRMNPGRLPW